MKKTSRKTARARTTSKNTEKLFLNDVPAEFIFWLCDGRTIKNMKELGEALNTMSDDIYAYHVNSEKNDFSKWVNDIITDTRLSSDLAGAGNRESAAKIVMERVELLSRQL